MHQFCWTENLNGNYFLLPGLDDWELTRPISCLMWYHNICIIYICPLLQQNKSKRLACKRTGRKAIDLKPISVLNRLNILHQWFILCERICCLAFSGELQCILWFSITMRAYSLVEQRLFLEMGFILSVILEGKCHCPFSSLMWSG